MSSSTVERIRDSGQAIKMIKDTEEKLMKFIEEKMRELYEEIVMNIISPAITVP
jgi:hypothetical protein